MAFDRFAFRTSYKAPARLHEEPLTGQEYDEHANYRFSRSYGAIPIIDYNPRNEKLLTAALKERGYDRNGWPYAPCGILTRPNGFDFNSKRASFTCRRLCVTSKDPILREYATDCPYWINYHGFTKHMSVREFPRLITEVIRGTDRHQKIKALRSASERTNSTAKDDLCILAKPKVRGLKNAGILSHPVTTPLASPSISASNIFCPSRTSGIFPAFLHLLCSNMLHSKLT